MLREPSDLKRCRQFHLQFECSVQADHTRFSQPVDQTTLRAGEDQRACIFHSGKKAAFDQPGKLMTGSSLVITTSTSRVTLEAPERITDATYAASSTVGLNMQLGAPVDSKMACGR